MRFYVLCIFRPQSVLCTDGANKWCISAKKNEYKTSFNSLIHIKALSRRIIQFHISWKFSEYPFTERGLNLHLSVAYKACGSREAWIRRHETGTEDAFTKVKITTNKIEVPIEIHINKLEKNFSSCFHLKWPTAKARWKWMAWWWWKKRPKDPMGYLTFFPLVSFMDRVYMCYIDMM